MNDIPHLDWASLAASSERLAQPFHDKYYAMYSSVYGGIVTDPSLMLVPADDHVVHRGDGIFETLKCVDGSLYNLPAHLERLSVSADAVDLSLPCSEAELTELMRQTVRAGGRRDAQVRVLLSRGPGSLSVNPYDCPSPQLYIIAAALKPPFMEQHPEGARVKVSTIPVKPSFFATVKSCNYLPNVLMKKEAIDAGVDFVVSLDERGHLAESATENVAMVPTDGMLVVPRDEHILPGTTMKRALELAQSLIDKGMLTGIEERHITREDMLDAAEMLVIGTTPNVTAVAEFEGRRSMAGTSGPVFRALSALLADDILHNPAMRTPVFD